MAPKKNAAAAANASASTKASSSSSASPAVAVPATTGTTSSVSSKTSQDPQAIAQGIWNSYVADTPQRVKLVDAFMLFLVVVGGLQFLYCIIVGNYPFNAFLSGFSATVGQFVLTASLRIQTNPANKDEFKGISHERAFADYVFGSMILHFFCINFIN